MINCSKQPSVASLSLINSSLSWRHEAGIFEWVKGQDGIKITWRHVSDQMKLHSQSSKFQNVQQALVGLPDRFACVWFSCNTDALLSGFFEINRSVTITEHFSFPLPGYTCAFRSQGCCFISQNEKMKGRAYQPTFDQHGETMWLFLDTSEAVDKVKHYLTDWASSLLSLIDRSCTSAQRILQAQMKDNFLQWSFRQYEL